MHNHQNSQTLELRIFYEAPCLHIVRFCDRDVIATSGDIDENQGEWDPQNLIGDSQDLIGESQD